MNTMLKKVGLGAALAATALTTAVPADAQRYRRYRGRGDAGPAIVAGIAGLAVGAAIASGNRDRYYRGHRPYYYRDHYYGRPYRYGYYGYGGCWVERRWDPYWGHPVRVRVCR
jgi:hypothetical protein